MVRTLGYEEYFEAPGHWGRSYASSPKPERDRVDAIGALLPADVGTVLDVGCGDGLIANELARRGFDVTGTDLSEEALKHVRTPKVHVDSTALPFADRSFDCVLCALVLEHLPRADLEQVVGELARVAGRYLLIDVPDREDLRLGQTRCPECQTAFHIGRHVRSISESDVLGWFPGFERVVSTTTGHLIVPRPRPLQLVLELLGHGARPSSARCPTCGLQLDAGAQAAHVREAKGSVKRLAARVGAARHEELLVLLARS